MFLASEGAEGLYTRRIEGPAVTLVRCMEIQEGDILEFFEIKEVARTL